MLLAEPSDADVGTERRSPWTIVVAIALLHVALAAFFKFGFPEIEEPRKSDITIELGGVRLTRQGGVGVKSVSAATQPVLKVERSAKTPLPPAQPSADAPLAAAAAVVTPSAVSDAAPSVESPLSIDADYKAAYLNNPKPRYPPVAFQLRVEGTVMLKALVLPDGRCGEVLLSRSSGNDLIDRSALDTVIRWRFTPAKAQGKEVSQWVSIPITFSLKHR
jgi:periplasmic protein TonB